MIKNIEGYELNIHTDYPAKSVSYSSTPRSLSNIKYIVIHYTGNKGDKASSNARYYAQSNTRTAGAHFFVDKSGEVYRSIAMKYTAWSVGGDMRSGDGGGRLYGKCTNANSVSIELCDCLDNAGYKQSLAVRMLVKYIKSECPNAKTIVRHWDVNGKHCPAPMIGKNNLKWKHLKNFINGKRVFIAKVTETAYVRKKPTVNSDSVLTLEKGAKIKVIGEKGKWGKVRIKGAVRYVNLTKITFSK